MSEVIGELRYIMTPLDARPVAGAEARFDGESCESPEDCARWLDEMLKLAKRKRYVRGSYLWRIKNERWWWSEMRRTARGRCGFVFTGRHGVLQRRTNMRPIMKTLSPYIAREYGCAHMAGQTVVRWPTSRADAGMDGNAAAVVLASFPSYTVRDRHGRYLFRTATPQDVEVQRPCEPWPAKRRGRWHLQRAAHGELWRGVGGV